LILIPFRASHIDEMRGFGGQTWAEAHFDSTDPRSFETLGPCWSGAVGGEIIGSAGLIKVHDYRAIAWAMLSNEAPKHFKSIHKAAKAFFSDQPFKRVEAYIDEEFPAARRWIKALGFQLEKEHLRYFLPDGRSAALWARIRD
jgi:RimJ/RimL family protein N-acetyltransferase